MRLRDEISTDDHAISSVLICLHDLKDLGVQRNWSKLWQIHPSKFLLILVNDHPGDTTEKLMEHAKAQGIDVRKFKATHDAQYFITHNLGPLDFLTDLM